MPSNIFFTSDTHFGHANIIKYSHRPFESVEQMDEALIENWNSRVRGEDVVYHLGDFAFAKYDRILQILSRLNGQKHLLRGNHDGELDKAMQYRIDSGWDIRVAEYLNYKELKIGKQHIVLSHYPFERWNRSHFGAWHLHGHEHGSLEDRHDILRMDVGVDAVGTWLAPHFTYAPISLDEVRLVMAGKDFKPIQHH
jgi:calcineurin-like phosphoesterase family protein